LISSLGAAAIVAFLLTMNLPRLRRPEGSFTGLRRGRVR
jgi:hypothetical protein